MKAIIIINSIIPFIACIHAFRVLIISYSIDRYMKVRSIYFELADEKEGYIKAGRAYIYLVLLSNVIWLSWNVNRMLNDFIPFATPYIMWSSIGFSLVLWGKAYMLVVLSSGNGRLKRFKKLKI